MVIERAMEHFKDSKCIFVEEELHRLRNELSEIASVLEDKCRLFVMGAGSENPIEVKDMSTVHWDADIFLSVREWNDGYDTEIVSTDQDSNEEIENCEGWLLEGEKY